MLNLMFWVLLGGFVIFGLPLARTRWLPHPWGSHNFLLDSLVRVVGGVIILLAIISTSYVHVPDGRLATLFRIYGGSPLNEGKIIAANGENGPQARILTPGFHLEFLVNILYDVDTSKSETEVPDGKVGILVAKDGAAFEPGQAFGNPFPNELGYKMLDAEVFLSMGGQRGPQLSVLTPGKYRLNPYLWAVSMQDAKEVPVGVVGVVKSNIWANIDFGTIKSDKPADCRVVERMDSAGDQQIAAPVYPLGCTGVWQQALQPGRYYYNPQAFVVTDVDTRAQVWEYAGNYTRSNITLTVDSQGGIVQARNDEKIALDPENADQAVFVKMEGWDVPLELRVVAQVSPEDASCVVSGIGTLKEVEDRVITPSIRAITRDVAGGTYTVTEPRVDEEGKPVLGPNGEPVLVTVNRQSRVLDLINQRQLIEGEIERRIIPEAKRACVTIREIRLGEPAIPPELLVAVRREQLATQLSRAFIQEQLAQTQRIASENAKETANQQNTLVQAEIAVRTSERRAIAAKNEGQGEKDKLELIAAGQQSQAAVLGQEATVQLRQYELMLTKLTDFFGTHPEVLTTALTNANKFVPNISVGGDSGFGGMVSALLGQSLNNLAAPTSPQSAPPSVPSAVNAAGQAAR